MTSTNAPGPSDPAPSVSFGSYSFSSAPVSSVFSFYLDEPSGQDTDSSGPSQRPASQRPAVQRPQGGPGGLPRSAPTVQTPRPRRSPDDGALNAARAQRTAQRPAGAYPGPVRTAVATPTQRVVPNSFRTGQTVSTGRRKRKKNSTASTVIAILILAFILFKAIADGVVAGNGPFEWLKPEEELTEPSTLPDVDTSEVLPELSTLPDVDTSEVFPGEESSGLSNTVVVGEESATGHRPPLLVGTPEAVSSAIPDLGFTPASAASASDWTIAFRPPSFRSDIPEDAYQLVSVGQLTGPIDPAEVTERHFFSGVMSEGEYFYSVSVDAKAVNMDAETDMPQPQMRLQGASGRWYRGFLLAVVSAYRAEHSLTWYFLMDPAEIDDVGQVIVELDTGTEYDASVPVYLSVR